MNPCKPRDIEYTSQRENEFEDCKYANNTGIYESHSNFPCNRKRPYMTIEERRDPYFAAYGKNGPPIPKFLKHPQ